MAVFKWNLNDVESLLKGARDVNTEFHFSQYEILRSNPTFVSYLIEEISSRHSKSSQARYILSVLKWIRLHPFAQNEKDHLPIVQEKTNSSNEIEAVVSWFPQWAKEEIRTRLDAICLKIEGFDDRTPDDVTVDKGQKVIEWKATNDRDIVLKSGEVGGKYELEERTHHGQRYSLKFEAKSKIMYQTFGVNYLSDRRMNICVIATFKCDKDDSISSNSAQFIVNNCVKKSVAFRGFSVSPNTEQKDEIKLYAHGLDQDQYPDNKLFVANLEYSKYYTFLIMYGNEQSNGRNSYFSLYKDMKILVDNVGFLSNSMQRETYALLSVGGIKQYRSSSLQNCFTGSIANIEIIKNEENFPESILYTIVHNQRLRSWFSNA